MTGDVPPHSTTAATQRLTVPRPDVLLQACFASPATGSRAPGVVPGVVIVHEILGFTPHIQSLPARFAAEGFAALAVDFFAREGAAPDGASRDGIQRFARALPDARATADIAASLELLAARPEVDPARLAVVGFSWGATQSLHANAAGLPLRAVVAFYPKPVYPALLPTRPVHPVDRVPDFHAPLCAHFGARDRAIPPEEVATLADALARRGLPHEVYVYAGATHGFFNPSQPRVFHAEAAELAWGRTLHFLRETLA